MANEFELFSSQHRVGKCWLFTEIKPNQCQVAIGDIAWNGKQQRVIALSGDSVA
jgi:hypothetical protein